jgi:hypothetical protein
MRKLICLLMFAADLAALPWSVSAAQQTQGVRGRVPTLVAISPDLEGAETRFRLARFAGNAPRDVILLAPDADAATLTQAVEALLAVRRQSGDAATTNALLRTRDPQRARVLPWAARVVRDARAAPLRHIPGVGRLRAVQIWLPAQQRGGQALGLGN